MLYERLLRPLLFRMDAEEAHEKTARLMELVAAAPLGPKLAALLLGRAPAGLEISLWGLNFPNPIGLAAGFDKDCAMAAVLPALGFGFIEAGSITLNPQPGNPRPRLFRFPETEAIINRMGFNSAGADAAARRLQALGSHRVPIGVNLGLNADCPKERSPEAYAATFQRLADHGDYFVINVSSPNTAGLRALQERLHLERILDAIAAENKANAPVLIKLDCDMPDDQLPGIVALVQKKASGIVASNTTLSRPGGGDYGDTRGGLSGAPLRGPATDFIRRLRRAAGGALTIIGVGGIFSGRDAYEKIRAGASLVQLYSALIYRGPGVVSRIGQELLECLRRDGFSSVAEAVGSEVEE